MKQLARETAIYGASSIIGKFLNWLLVPMYSYVLAGSGEYGIVTNLYAWSALVIVIITYGMETGFFRFASRQEENANQVYSTALTSIAASSLVLALAAVFCRDGLARLVGSGASPEIVAMLAVTVAIDAFDSIPFAYLRHKKRAIRFATLKLVMIAVNIVMNIFFLVVCPWLVRHGMGAAIEWFWQADYGVGYIFVSNLISTLTVTLLLLPTILEARFSFSGRLLRRMLAYSLPIMLLGVVGIMNQTLDKIIFPIVYPDKTIALSELGIYGACFKVAMIMMMFTNAFRYAYEPFVFQKYGTRDCKESYSDAMKYYVIAALMIFLGMTFYMDVLQYLLAPEYRIGLRVVPLVLVSYLFQGVVYNLALWYKLVDKTYWGAIISAIGCVVSLVVQILLIPTLSYWGCVYASVLCYFIMMLLSYFLGQHYYPIDYQLRRIGMYALLAAGLWAAGTLVPLPGFWLTMLYRTALLAVFVAVVIKLDLPIGQLPIVKRLLHKK